ncbi:MAG: hypothetical protein JWQ42_4499 [Edaphobacter sp.]|nr:hypothetical protein [Edaphobacter sp.]
MTLSKAAEAYPCRASGLVQIADALSDNTGQEPKGGLQANHG